MYYLTTVKNLAIPNKYTNWYLNICANAQKRANNRKDAKFILGETEKHHILPVSFALGGQKDTNNFAYLSIREHVICHILLTKMFLSIKFKTKMIHALTQFCMGKRINFLTSKQLALARSARHSPCSESRAKNISNARKLTQKKKCVYCNKHVDPGNYELFHGTKCKLNPDLDPHILKERSIKRKNSANKSILDGTHKSNPQTKIVTCPHCNKSSTNSGSMKLHIEKCNLNPTPLPKRENYMRLISCINCRVTTNSGNFTKLHGPKCNYPKFSALLLLS